MYRGEEIAKEKVRDWRSEEGNGKEYKRKKKEYKEVC